MKKLFSLIAVSAIMAVSAFGFISTNPQFVLKAEAANSQDMYLYNPYCNVDWDEVNRYRTNIHTHTTNSDGSHLPAYAISKYMELGYSFLAITDHDKVTFPFEDYGYRPRPEKGDIIGIQGNELSSLHHTLSLFTNYENYLHNEQYEMLADAVAYDGGKGRFVIAHPGRYVKNLDMLSAQNSIYNLDWYTGIYKKYPTVLGMEVYNQSNRYKNDRIIYDKVLTELMPTRPVWATSNDDNHGTHYGYNNLSMLLGEYSQDFWQKALERGEFFTSSFAGFNPLQLDIREGDVKGRYKYEPIVDKIDVNEDSGEITITARQYTSIVWQTADGLEAGTGTTINFKTNQLVNKYLRATLVYSEDGVDICQTLVQPFGVGAYVKDSWYFYFDEKVPTLLAKNGCGSSLALNSSIILSIIILGGALVIVLIIKTKKI